MKVTKLPVLLDAIPDNTYLMALNDLSENPDVYQLKSKVMKKLIQASVYCAKYQVKFIVLLGPHYDFYLQMLKALNIQCLVFASTPKPGVDFYMDTSITDIGKVLKDSVICTIKDVGAQVYNDIQGADKFEIVVPTVKSAKILEGNPLALNNLYWKNFKPSKVADPYDRFHFDDLFVRVPETYFDDQMQNMPDHAESRENEH